MPVNDRIGFKFIAIQLISKKLAEITQPLNPAIVYNFNINAETRIQPDVKFILELITVIITEQNQPFEFFNIKVACVFEIEDFESVIKPNEHNFYVVPPQLEATLRPVAISTMRGIIFSELRGTHLSNAIMPVVFMDAFVPQPVPELKGESANV